MGALSEITRGITKLINEASTPQEKEATPLYSSKEKSVVLGEQVICE